MGSEASEVVPNHPRMPRMTEMMKTVIKQTLKFPDFPLSAASEMVPNHPSMPRNPRMTEQKTVTKQTRSTGQAKCYGHRRNARSMSVSRLLLISDSIPSKSGVKKSRVPNPKRSTAVSAKLLATAVFLSMCIGVCTASWEFEAGAIAYRGPQKVKILAQLPALKSYRYKHVDEKGTAGGPSRYGKAVTFSKTQADPIEEELSLSYDLEDEQEVSVARSNNSENDDVESSTTSESRSGKLDNKASSKSGESGKREHSTSRSSTAQVGQDMLARMQELESANQIDAKAKNPTVKGSSPRSGSGPFTPPPPRKLVKSASSRTNRPPRIGALPSVSETEVATTGRPSIAVDGNGTDVFRVLVPDDCVRDRRESVLCA